MLEAGLLSSLVIVLYRLLYSADSASITSVGDAGEDENKRVMVRR